MMPAVSSHREPADSSVPNVRTVAYVSEIDDLLFNLTDSVANVD